MYCDKSRQHRLFRLYKANYTNAAISEYSVHNYLVQVYNCTTKSTRIACNNKTSSLQYNVAY